MACPCLYDICIPVVFLHETENTHHVQYHIRRYACNQEYPQKALSEHFRSRIRYKRLPWYQLLSNFESINKNLEQQAQALFKAWFVDTENLERKVCHADECFDISIGKTPPRKEHEWFSTNTSDVKWVSISDMGSCGTFISDSSEYLTPEAIKKFNVQVVPTNTVLLSFKLTVGRIAITNDNMATNEAIAHFKTNDDSITEYLYCYLKSFKYQELGSTSSIATAVNSKIIKGMPFVVPTDKEKQAFHNIVHPIFSEIKNNQMENQYLSELRDTLLPKLMSGEIDVSDLKI